METVTKQMENLNVKVDTTSLMQYMPAAFADIKGPAFPPVKDASEIEQVTNELRAFGIKKLADLQNLYTPEFKSAYELHRWKEPDVETYNGLLRTMMMYADIDRYFSVAWKRSWSEWDTETYEMMAQKYGDAKMVEVTRTYYILDYDIVKEDHID